MTDYLTDEQIDALDTFALAWMAPRKEESVRLFARAVLAAAEPLIRASERERCAQLCMSQMPQPSTSMEDVSAVHALRDCAAAIRQLGPEFFQPKQRKM